MGIANLVGLFFSKTSAYRSAFRQNKPGRIDSLLIDMNGILHSATKDADMQNLDAYFNNVTSQLLLMIKELNPLKNLVMAIDGVAPLAKVEQQRMRRYKAGIERSAGKWDSNAITPGTSFMFEIDERFRKWLSNPRVREKLPRNVVYSSHLVPGEGEHKIMTWIRANSFEKENYVVYGLDADLILLSLNVPVNNVFLVRERLDRWMDILKIKKQIGVDMRLNNLEQASRDFMFMMSMIGNDFLPRILALHRLEHSISLMLKLYKNKEPLTTGQNINWRNVSLLIERLYVREYPLLQLVAEEKYEYPYHALRSFANQKKKQIDLLAEPVEEAEYQEQYTTVCDDYYDHVFSPKGIDNFPFELRKILENAFKIDRSVEIEKMCEQYLVGMGWVFNYYTIGDGNPSYVYPYRYAPMFFDLNVYAKENPELDVVKAMYEPTGGEFIFFSPLQVMVAVLPPKSIDLFPPQMRHIPTSILYLDMFPDRVYIEKEGTSSDTEWHQKALVPNVDVERVMFAVQQSKLSQRELTKYSRQVNLILYKSDIEIDIARREHAMRDVVQEFYKRPRFKQSADAWRDPSFLVV